MGGSSRMGQRTFVKDDFVAKNNDIKVAVGNDSV